MKKLCKVCNIIVEFGSNVNATTCESCLDKGFKYCSQCNVIKPLDNFKRVGKSASGKIRYSGECKDCLKRRHAAYYRVNVDKIKKQTNEYRKEHLEAYAEYSKMYKERNPTKRAEQQAKALKKYYDTPNGAMARKRNNERYNRQAKQGDLTATQWQLILETFDFKCAYCDSSEKLSMEHIIPVSKGGTLTKSNIIVACQHCNSSRGNMDIDIWLQFIDEANRAKIIWYINEGHRSIE